MKSILRNQHIAFLLGVLSLCGIAQAQEFPSYNGAGDRSGHHDASQATNNPDRAFLRWWDPLLAVSTILDNWDPATVQNPVNSWSIPQGGAQASFYEETQLNAIPPHDPYLWARPVASKSYEEYWLPDPLGPATSNFSWIFQGLTAGDEFALSVSLPIGPTDTDPTPLINLVYGTQYQVYEISGVDNPDNPGQPIYQKVNTYGVGGGWVRLGNDGNVTDRVFTVATGSTSITIKLINTIPRDSQGNLVDTRNNIAVYADAAKITRAAGLLGTYVASPITARLKEPGAVFPWRVWAARNESFSAVEGGQIKDFSYGMLTSFAHNGRPIIAGDTIGRRNMVFSWPALRPTSITALETERYATERLEFLQGTGKYPSAVSRFDSVVGVDNLSGNVSVSAGFVTSTAIPNFKGEDYLEGTTGGITDTATFAPQIKDGRYFVDVWSPGGLTFSDSSDVLIKQGAITVATIPVNFQTGGWHRLTLNTTVSWQNTQLAPLSVIITTAGSGTGNVPADMVRFTATSDVAITSTPVYARVGVRDSGGALVMRDVVFVAMENGHIYCLDAQGTVNGLGVPTGDTTVYWSYPSETGVDPNQVAGIDGKDMIAEMPTGFNLSSATVQNVGGEDRLYVGTTNGRVYCIDVAGRGDGTTTRDWSYPNDYPSPSVRSTLGAITGSVAFADTAAGPTIYVPTQQGRIYALDAQGNNVTRTTTVRWAYPDVAANPVGPISMTPSIGFGKIYFGTGAGSFGGNSTFFALDLEDTNADNIGDVIWSRTDGGGVNFIPFGTSGPAVAPSADVDGAGNYVFVANNNFNTYAFDADTGVDRWHTDELQTSPGGSLGFSWMRLPDTTTALVQSPVVVVPTVDGRYSALYARPADLNRSGTRLGWQVTLAGTGTVPAAAFGAKDTTLPDPIDDENCYMYGEDPSGYLYAWSYDPDFASNNQVITPGDPPIDITPEIPNDDLSDRLNDIVLRAKVSLLTPEAYRDLTERLRAGTLRYADVIRNVNQVTRQHYEVGETLYMVVYDLPDPAFYSPPTDYTLDLVFNAAGNATQRRAFSHSALLSPPSADKGHVSFAQWSIIPIGGNGLVPGKVSFTWRVLATERSGANRTIPTSNYSPQSAQLRGGDFHMANPLALGTVVAPNAAQSIGYTLDPSANEAKFNGNQISQSPNTYKSVGKKFSSDSSDAGDEVSHGQTGVTAVYVFDRSLMTLILGPDRGLQSVRMALNDLWWPSGTLVPYKHLGGAFPTLEDFPGSPGNNTSLDYPDIRRDRMQVTKSRFGQVENPIFQAVSLIPPIYTTTNYDQYRTDFRIYNQFLDRQMLPTVFDFDIDVPKYQPPAKFPGNPAGSGYFGPQFVFIDAQQTTRNFQLNVANEAFRRVDLTADVAVDERLEVGTPTVELSELPSGGGFSPVAPWLDPNFGLLNGMFQAPQSPYYERFSLLNDGNVNMINLRLAKQMQQENSAAVDPVLFFGANMANRSFIDARWHLHSDLDPQFLPNALSNRAILQKPRPGDSEPTRFRVNPHVRANANMGVADSDLLGLGQFANATLFDESKRDPKVAVSVPFGAPSGLYNQTIYPFEDRQFSALDATFPTLGTELGEPTVFEPYADPGITLRFSVREARLTNRSTAKSAPMVDQLGLTGNEPLIWANAQPSAVRSGSGTLFVAFSSDRLTSTNTPGFAARAKIPGDTTTRKQVRIYIASVANGGQTPTSAYTQLSDLSTFQGTGANQWFIQAVDAYPSQPASVLFNVPAAEIDQGSLAYTDPVFPSSGTFEPLSAPGALGKTEAAFSYMAFLGKMDRQLTNGERRSESRLFIARVDLNPNGSVVAGAPVPLEMGADPNDPQAKFGHPSLVRSGPNATVFYTLSSGSGSQIVWSTFDGTQWRAMNTGPRANYAESIRIGSAFDSLANPSAVLRRYQNGGQGRIDLVYSGRLKGRSQPEVYMSRINTNGNGVPVQAGGSYTIAYGTRFDRVEHDPRTGLYWAPGAEWRRNGNDTTQSAEVATDPFSATFIDVKYFDSAAGVWRSVLDYSTRTNENGSMVDVFDTIFGGKAYVDSSNGTIRFSGALLPKTAVLFARYTPKALRVAGNDGMNYRSPNLLFDERFIGDNSYWVTPANAAAPLSNPIRSDRFILGYAKTSATVTDRSRPYMKTFRFGGLLPTSVLTDAQGRVVNMVVTGAGSEYQVEPATGKLYFQSDMEDRIVTVSYRGVDDHGRDLGVIQTTLRIGLLLETNEASIPMDELANESSVNMTLDPQGGTFNVNGNVFPFNSTNAGSRRPGLIWTFWSSTRGGGSDLYFQTLAPRFGSIQVGN